MKGQILAGCGLCYYLTLVDISISRHPVPDIESQALYVYKLFISIEMIGDRKNWTDL